MKRALMLIVLAACSSASSTPTAPPPPAAPPAEGSGSAAGYTGSASTDPLADVNPGMGDTCGPNDACARGYECVKYYGIAGARGPQFKTCEIRCEMQNKESACPPNSKCTTIADGPGQVCR
jgi:hypothetical protein